MNEQLEDFAGLASNRQLSGSTIAARPPGLSDVLDEVELLKPQSVWTMFNINMNAQS